MKIYDYPSEAAEKKLATIVNRGLNFKKKDVSAVNRILEDVRRNGDGALIKYVNRFDAPDLQTGSLAVTESEFREATRQVDAAFRRALNR
ncbi:MAG: histidinol dehydrogenase, partial [Desulfobacterales bacterium]